MWLWITWWWVLNLKQFVKFEFKLWWVIEWCGLNSKKIPNKIIIELVYIIFDFQIDDKNLRNIIKNANTHISNTNYTMQFTKRENNELEIEYIKSNNCL